MICYSPMHLTVRPPKCRNWLVFRIIGVWRVTRTSKEDMSIQTPIVLYSLIRKKKTHASKQVK